MKLPLQNLYVHFDTSFLRGQTAPQLLNQDRFRLQPQTLYMFHLISPSVVQLRSHIGCSDDEQKLN